MCMCGVNKPLHTIVCLLKLWYYCVVDLHCVVNCRGIVFIFGKIASNEFQIIAMHQKPNNWRTLPRKQKMRQTDTCLFRWKKWIKMRMKFSNQRLSGAHAFKRLETFWISVMNEGDSSSYFAANFENRSSSHQFNIFVLENKNKCFSIERSSFFLSLLYICCENKKKNNFVPRAHGYIIIKLNFKYAASQFLCCYRVVSS